jgi:hypothetical protein
LLLIKTQLYVHALPGGINDVPVPAYLADAGASLDLSSICDAKLAASHGNGLEMMRRQDAERCILCTVHTRAHVVCVSMLHVPCWAPAAHMHAGCPMRLQSVQPQLCAHPCCVFCPFEVAHAVLYGD